MQYFCLKQKMYLFPMRWIHCIKQSVVFSFLEHVLLSTQRLAQLIQFILSGFSGILFPLQTQNGGRKKSWCLFFEVSPDESARMYDRVRERDGGERVRMRREMRGKETTSWLTVLGLCRHFTAMYGVSSGSLAAPCGDAPTTDTGRGVSTPLNAERAGISGSVDGW